GSREGGRRAAASARRDPPGGAGGRGEGGGAGARGGVALSDHFGHGYAVVVHDPRDAAGLVRAAGARGLPLRVVAIGGAPPSVRAAYPERLVLVRPDRLIAWRGDYAPDAASVLAAAAGFPLAEAWAA
ncbi:hypothetical protein OJ997_22255, partial [Solirubrobacter phytolaccae]|nr:hypothetical protein [Solirubrobacter phytolaccae]